MAGPSDRENAHTRCGTVEQHMPIYYAAEKLATFGMHAALSAKKRRSSII